MVECMTLNLSSYNVFAYFHLLFIKLSCSFPFLYNWHELVIVRIGDTQKVKFDLVILQVQKF